jgi:hypothetical protein
MNEKKKHKIMLGIEVVLLCMIVAILGTNAASSNPPSNGVSYGKNNQATVEVALNDLYTKANYGNATAAQILKGKTALVGGKQVTGTYEAPNIESQTPGDATQYDIAQGKIAWVNGERIVGKKQFTVITNFLKVGDYVKYTPNRTSYKVSASDTGYVSDQSIRPNALDSWRIIRINDDGTIEMVSVNISDKIVFNGETGYKNYVGTLNKIAKAYETEGITVGSRALGYDANQANEYLTSIAKNGNPDYGYSTDMDLMSDAGMTRASNGTYYLASRANFDISKDSLYSKHLSGGKYSIRVVGFRPTYWYYSCISGCMGDSCCGTVSSSPGWSIWRTYGGDPIDDHVNLFPAGSSYGMRPVVVVKADASLLGGRGEDSDPWLFGI